MFAEFSVVVVVIVIILCFDKVLKAFKINFYATSVMMSDIESHFVSDRFLRVVVVPDQFEEGHAFFNLPAVYVKTDEGQEVYVPYFARDKSCDPTIEDQGPTVPLPNEDMISLHTGRVINPTVPMFPFHMVKKDIMDKVQAELLGETDEEAEDENGDVQVTDGQGKGEGEGEGEGEGKGDQDGGEDGMVGIDG